MTREQYLRLALLANCYKKKAWIISAFSLIQEAADAYKSAPYPYRIVQSATGFYFVDPQNEGRLTQIEDAAPGEPLFTFLEPVDVNSGICANVPQGQVISTCIGNLLFNLCCMVKCFGAKLPFVTGRVSVSKIEEEIAKTLTAAPPDGEERSNTVIYIDEYNKFADALSFMAGLTQLCVWTATERTMRAPTGVKEFKAALLEKYKGKLTDPLELSKFEKEIQKFDADYLKGDPTDGIFTSGKIKNISRKKLYLLLGSEEGFSNSLDVVPVINSLSDGWSTDPQQFTAMLNGVRSASYFRGADTVKGGVSAKVILRSTSNLMIRDTDCKTEIGLMRNLPPEEVGKLEGRYIRLSNQWTLLKTKEETAAYAGKDIEVRSPMYCKLDGDNLCRFCIGEKLSENPNGISIALTEISGIILATSMARMHGVVLSTAYYDIKRALT